MVNEVNRIAELLLDAWKKADPKSSVALHPTSYVATFADMAKAIIEDRNTRPAAPVVGLERFYPTGEDVIDHDGDFAGVRVVMERSDKGAYVRFDQAEAIIAAEREGKRFWQNEYTQKSKLLLQAEADNAALTARVRRITDALSNVVLIDDVGHYVNDTVSAHIKTLETQLAAARKALEWYANPEIYKPHPHGVAFDNRDVSYVARAALEGNP